MLSASAAATVARRAAVGLVGTTALGATAATAYAQTEQGSGLKRQCAFWSRTLPTIAGYYVRTASSSPFVRLQNATIYRNEDDTTRKARKKETLTYLHEKHAPDILQVMLDLKGLYIKLGQVLSVTALPIPEQYKEKFRTLQSDVPGWEEFENVIKPTLEAEFGKPIHEIFEYVNPVPCGAASIGQAHQARLKPISEGEAPKEVVVKVQYKDAAWKVPADIECVGDFLRMCVYFGVVDEESANISYEEFSSQFLAELNYDQELANLEAVYKSSLDPTAPYIKQNVVIPQPFPGLSTKRVITMSYLPGPKLEVEAKKQLEMLGIDTSGGIAQIVKDAAKDAAKPNEVEGGEVVRRVTKRVDERHHSPFSWKFSASRIVGQIFGFDSILWAVRQARRLVLWSQAAAVASIKAAPRVLISPSLEEWADAHQTALAQAQRLSLTAAWITALFDVHGHQIFSLSIFNADPHPGNILVVEEENDRKPSSKLGLIDYGQCRHLTPDEQYKVARLILTVANNEPDENIARAFRDMDIKTKNDSTEFLAKFGKLMFGPFKAEHLDHGWHMKLHKMDKVLYFPKELSMVYRTSLLLRGLAVSLQLNYSVGEQWKHHAAAAVERIDKNGR
uniref:ABC1 atypical kinase-like domain-containing protein n=1 Tax=Odontella aurita TaxID=265563 RepID=A0A7S4IJN0_9STRA|mmetsp:Transcript_26119/g.77300  ORF Transcript_26119/g.77300 Transcript_26119/m.77300 type:complete len:619 (+) Transcript_26119:61-1917(+)